MPEEVVRMPEYQLHSMARADPQQSEPMDCEFESSSSSSSSSSTHRDRRKAWAVLVCGGSRSSHYGKPSRPWKDLGGEIPFLVTMGSVYAQMARELGPDHVIVIASLGDTLSWLEGMVQRGYSEPFDPIHREASKSFYGDPEESRRKWHQRLLGLRSACSELLANGGADYEGTEVNPTTVLRVLAGEGPRRTLPKTGVGGLFFWVTTHGSSHPISINSTRTATGHTVPVPIADEAECNTSESLDSNEWFWIMPHPATDPKPYDFVRLAGYTMDPDADPGAEHPHLPRFAVYWQQVFSVLHASLMEDQGRRVVAFYQFCLSGGHLNFLQRPAIRKHWGVDNWPIYMIASSGAIQYSLGATLTNIFLEKLRQRFAQGGVAARVSLKTFMKELEQAYWMQHTNLHRTNQQLPKELRVGEMQHYHTPAGGIQDAPLAEIFSNQPALREGKHCDGTKPADIVATSNGHGREESPPQEQTPQHGQRKRGHEDPDADQQLDAIAAQSTVVALIVEMGFPRVDVEAALEAAGGQPDLAVEKLLSR